MSKAKNLTPNQRGQVLLLHQDGKSYREISKQLKLSVSACYQAVQHIKVHGTKNNVVRKRKPRKTNARTDRLIHRISKADRHKTAVDVHAEVSRQIDQKVSVRTIRRRLNEFGLMGRIGRKKPYISEKNRRARIAFAREHINWTSEQWSKVIFTDESKFNRFGSDGRSYVRRRIGEEFDWRCTKPTVKGGGGSVLIWGSMSINGTGPSYRIEGIMDRFVYLRILENILLPFAEEFMPNDWIYQADNDPKHTARVVKQFLDDHNVNIMKWPAQSPDLNPIEMLWLDVEKQIKQQKPKNIHELNTVIEKSWNSIPVDRCIRLIKSMPRRCAEVLRQNGRATKY